MPLMPRVWGFPTVSLAPPSHICPILTTATWRPIPWVPKPWVTLPPGCVWGFPWRVGSYLIPLSLYLIVGCTSTMPLWPIWNLFTTSTHLRWPFKLVQLYPIGIPYLSIVRTHISYATQMPGPSPKKATLEHLNATRTDCPQCGPGSSTKPELRCQSNGSSAPQMQGNLAFYPRVP